MVHHSRVGTLMIDCVDAQFDRSLEFWSAALGLRARRPRPGQRYVTLGRLDGPLFVRMQRVSADPGYHLDIETDRVPAEVARLEAAGARRKSRVRRWWVMEDPCGNAFCVIRPESDGFPGNANAWGADR